MPWYAWIAIIGMVFYFILTIVEIFVKSPSPKEESELDADTKPSVEERLSDIEVRLEKLEKEEEPVSLDVIV